MTPHNVKVPHVKTFFHLILGILKNTMRFNPLDRIDIIENGASYGVWGAVLHLTGT